MLCHFFRDYLLFDGVRVDSVIDFREGALEVPFEGLPAGFINFKPVKLLYEVKLEFR
jgi:hypothetical protein